VSRPLASRSCSDVSSAPSTIRWTDHAFVKASVLNVARTDVEDLVFGHHVERVRNSGAGAWKVVGRGIAVIYDHPDHDDTTAARIVTLWRQR
jgi:hypothetical protein